MLSLRHWQPLGVFLQYSQVVASNLQYKLPSHNSVRVYLFVCKVLILLVLLLVVCFLFVELSLFDCFTFKDELGSHPLRQM